MPYNQEGGSSTLLGARHLFRAFICKRFAIAARYFTRCCLARFTRMAFFRGSSCAMSLSGAEAPIAVLPMRQQVGSTR
jgi:hypothetical protein